LAGDPSRLEQNPRRHGVSHIHVHWIFIAKTWIMVDRASHGMGDAFDNPFGESEASPEQKTPE
jgi:hypothetical protein